MGKYEYKCTTSALRALQAEAEKYPLQRRTTCSRSCCLLALATRAVLPNEI